MPERPSPGLTRRRLLGTAAATGVATAATSLLPPSVRAAVARPMPAGGLRSIEHVVVLMQENRAFDHYYGSLRGVRGFGDADPLRLPGGESVLHQPDGTGRVLPFSVRDAAARAGRPDSDIEYLGALAHGFTDATQAWGSGWYDAWVPAKTAATMTFYQRRDLALQYELADTFTICDAYHCSVFGSTNPNRNYLWTGKVGTEPGSTARAVTNAAYDYDHAGYDWTTYPERLEAAGTSWQIYQEWDNFTDNPVEYFVPFKRVGTKVLASVEGTWRTTEELYTAMLDMDAAEQRQRVAQIARGRATLTAAERSLFDRAIYRSEPGTLVDRIAADVAAGTLPAVTWVVPTAADSEHPSAGTPVGSANLVYRLLDVLASDRPTWDSTATFLDFDENDGYFDHVPPPVAPRPESGNGPDWYDGRPIGLGPRVPMTVISPWTIGGHVDSTVSDHTSVLRFLERWTGVDEPNISSWRRQVCGDLTSAFDFDRAGRPPRLAHPGPVPDPIGRWTPGPPGEQRLPVQEPGRRPTRPLYYGPAIGTRVTADGVRLDLSSHGRDSAHFTIYPYAGELPEPAHHDVASSTTVRVDAPRGAYDLAVQGPDRFWARLAGRTDGAARSLVVAARAAARATLRVELDNRGAAPLTVRVGGRRVALAARTSRVLVLPTDRGWYDVDLAVVQEPGWSRTLTGRVGAERPGVSAPT
ncbi:phospholipase C, phosphocholine-specific [Marmoricola endophyticus]|uniref:phospholipase C n=1 Tax=Marmoricola endophyticus TaxID=2040280 RepID=A0A917BV20_9ACTN|nr:phospholipase C, phosphocholine-specific [Marmoricola endophyticus]GGF57334.1 phospholipase C, phosphocholine-specific [Marmoricola endophyticus]